MTIPNITHPPTEQDPHCRKCGEPINIPALIRITHIVKGDVTTRCKNCSSLFIVPYEVEDKS
jgi:RNase P subunit RPR2